MSLIIKKDVRDQSAYRRTTGEEHFIDDSFCLLNLQQMVISLLGLLGVSAAELVVEAKKREQDYAVTLPQANVENLA